MVENGTQRVFGQVVREARLKAGFSLEELADLAELHRTYVSLLERGERNPSLLVVTAIAGALGMKTSALVVAMEAYPRRR